MRLKTLGLEIMPLLVVWLLLAARVDAVNTIVVAGTGGELTMMQRLATAYERAHPGAVVDIRWDRNLRLDELIQRGEADLAVTGSADPDFFSTPIAWDGITIIVNFANPIPDVTQAQLADIFAGRLRNWEQVGGPPLKMRVIQSADTHMRAGLVQALGLGESDLLATQKLRSDQAVLNAVGGNLGAVGYLSLRPALEAVEFGMPVRLLTVDGVEPAEPTVRSGRYPLRRSVYLVSGGRQDAVHDFADFVLSPPGQRLVGEAFVPYGGPAARSS